MKNLVLSLFLITGFLSCQPSTTASDTQENTVEDSISTTEHEVKYQKAADFSLVDINGNQKSLQDYQGKLIYMDIWATWCGPCLQQIPALKAFEEKYKNTPIVFLSISVDPDQHQFKWENMVKEKELKGEQLFAGKASGFEEAYRIDYIPRFLLISPHGDIMMDSAPQPLDFNTNGMNPMLEQIFDLYLQTNYKQK